MEAVGEVAVGLSVLIDVWAERQRQEQMKREGRFAHTCADVGPMSAAEKLTVLAEEFGEAARAILEDDGASLREELIHVAAVAVAFVESLTDTEHPNIKELANVLTSPSFAVVAADLASPAFAAVEARLEAA